jgi:lipopolysaccharide export LptBFGC system permease protein LptF
MGAFVAWVSEWYMPEYAQWAKRLKTERFDSDDAAEAEGFTFRNTRCDRTWTVRGEASRDCSVLSDVFVTQDRPDGSRLYSMTAEKAAYLDGEWWFTKPQTLHYDINTRPCASPTPALDALELRAFPEFRERPEDIRMQNCDPRFISVRGKLRYIRINRDLDAEGRESLRYDAWAQALAPLSCIIVMLLSIPAGVTSGRQSVFAGILGAVGLFFAYHGFNVGCMVLAKSSLMPSVAAAVVPILIFLSLGVFFFFNSMRSTLCLFGIYAALFVFYVAAAALFVSKLEMCPLAAHITAFPAPLIAAVLCTFRFRLRA